jgi:hypothetical protein
MEIISFFVGSILIGVAVIGGGFEAKEIKIPRVGPGVRVVSLFFGMGFIVLALALFGIGLKQTLDRGEPSVGSALAAGPLTGTASDTLSTAAQVSDSETEPASEGSTAESNTAADPLAAEDPNAADEAAFAGFDGPNVLTWYVGETPLTGAVEANGTTGTVTVTWTNADGVAESVDEDLQLQQDGDRFFYVGSNPRYSGTSTPYAGYDPDYFTLRPADDGWTYAKACDSSGCRAITDIRAGR